VTRRGFGVLSAFQVEVAQAFFSIPQARDFVLAGGAALAAQGLTSRPTQDLDFFAQPSTGTVLEAVEAFEELAYGRGWEIQHLRDSSTFVRLMVRGEGNLVVDLAIDSAPASETVMSFVGPTFDPAELAGRKLLALFGRAEARDFVDVYWLAQRFGTQEMIKQAERVDAGLDLAVLSEMIATLHRFARDELPIKASERADLMSFFDEWRRQLD